MVKEKKGTRIRKPVESEIDSEVDEKDETPVPVITKPEPKPESSAPAKSVNPPKTIPSGKKVPRAQVSLDGASSLRRQGRTFVRGRPFFVEGEEAIEFFKRDSRFIVVREP